MVKEINKEEFNSEVINSNTPVLVDFYANWCGPCKMLKPILNEVKSDKVKIVSIDVDDADEIASKYNISSIPCLILINNGNEVKRNIGLISKDEIERFIGDI